MNPQNEARLRKKIAATCEATLSTSGYVTPSMRFSGPAG